MLVWLLPLSGHSPPYVGRARTPPATHLQQNMAEDGVVQKVYLEPGSRYAQDQGHRFDGASTSMPPMLTPGGTHGMASDHSYVERPRALDTEPYRTMTRTRVRDRFTQSIDPWDRETSGENVIALLEPLARSERPLIRRAPPGARHRTIPNHDADACSGSLHTIDRSLGSRDVG